MAKLNRRSFLKSLGAGTAALSFSSAMGPWVMGQNPLIVGMANPLATFFGQAAEKALRLRISQFNANGGIMGRPLALVTSDSAGRPDQALRAVQDLVFSKGAHVLTGFFFSEELLGALPAIGQGGQGRLFLGTGASTPNATVQVQLDYAGYKNFFRVGPVNSLFILQLLVGFLGQYALAKLGWQKIAVLAEDAAWSQAITDSLPVLLAANKIPMQVVDTVRYAEDTTDFSSIFSRLVDSGAQGIITVMAHTGLRPTAQWAQLQVPLPLVGVNVQAQDGSFNELTGGAAESVVTFTAGAKAPITDKTVPFVEAFENFTEFLPDVTIPSYNAFISSDAMDVLADSIERAGAFPDQDRDAVIAAMEQTDIVGTTGGISFYQLNEVGVSPLRPELAFPHDVRFGKVTGVWVQWQSGKLEVLFPGNLASADFVLPPWLA